MAGNFTASQLPTDYYSVKDEKTLTQS